MWQEIQPAELAQERKPGKVIDVREYPEFTAGAIPRARLAPLRDLEELSRSWDRNERHILVCRSGKRSKQAAELLCARGFTNVAVLDGGTQAWVAAGLPVERQKGPWSLERQVRFAAGSLVFAGTVLGTFVHPWFHALAGFVGAGLVFAALTDTCMMGSLLARLPWNRTASCQM